MAFTTDFPLHHSPYLKADKVIPFIKLGKKPKACWLLYSMYIGNNKLRHFGVALHFQVQAKVAFMLNTYHKDTTTYH